MLEGVVPWPEQAAEFYRKLGYWRGEPIGDSFDRSIAENAARLAVTYRELGAMVERLALHFAERGVASGRRVIFQLPNGLECVAALMHRHDRDGGRAARRAAIGSPSRRATDAKKAGGGVKP